MSNEALYREGGYLSLQMPNGVPFSRTISYIAPTYPSGAAIDMTGWTALTMKVRRGYGETVLFTPTVVVNSPATAGIIQIDVTAAVLAAITPGSYVYDIIYTDASSVVHELLYGPCIVIGTISGS